MSDNGFEELDRRRPYDLEAEQALLGAMLLDKSRCPELLGTVTAAEYYRPLHGQIHQAIAEMVGRGDVADPITLPPVLAAMGARLPDPGYLHTLTNSVPSSAVAWQYAEIVRHTASLRDAIKAGTDLVERGYGASAEHDATALVESAIEQLRQVRDRTMRGEAREPLDLIDFLDQDFEEPDWVIPGVLARWDRLIITAPEGGGKSLMLRQLLMRTAAGLHPWKPARIEPKRCLLIDAENSASQAWPWLHKMARAAAAAGAPIGRGQVVIEIPDHPLDLTTPGDRAWLLRLAERVKPDLVAIGPLYKLTSNGKNDEEAARPVVQVLEHLRSATDGAALLIEAHAPHPAPGAKVRDLRPIGSTIWRRWPEFGFGLLPVTDAEEQGATAQRLMHWQSWRGPRSERDWPDQFVAGATWPWQACQKTEIPTQAPPADAGIGLRTITAQRAAELGLWDDEESA